MILLVMYHLINTNNISKDPSKILNLYTDISDLGFNSASAILVYRKLYMDLINIKLLSFYKRYDNPLILDVYKMEERGIMIDDMVLESISIYFENNIKDLENKIFDIVGCSFNISSSKQLSDVLFVTLGIEPDGKKNSSGYYSTNSSVLHGINVNNENYSPLINYLITYKHLSKLQNAYTKSLKKFQDDNSLIHTNYNIFHTSTGRFSSKNPNLQSIPTRTEEGKKIRTAFISRPGMSLVSVDYSQIELYLLAYMAKVEGLINALENNRDLHEETAKSMFNVDTITTELRNKAKAINFGVIYGISKFGLAKNTGLTTSEAQQYIDSYFSTYPEVKEYMEYNIKYARKNKYVKTVFGRNCYINGINNKVYTIRKMAERAAINAPLQGSASDILRKAIVLLCNSLKQYNAYCILQIHDEIIFEIADEQIKELLPIIKRIMEKEIVYPQMKLKTNISVGKVWSEL